MSDYIIHVRETTPATLRRLQDDYSDSGYMNFNAGDIIIDMTYIEDDSDQLENFCEITGLTTEEIEKIDASYFCFYA
jgi:allophanate hydrolase subunit 1